ncbi:MAG: sigma 54-interacting transcriptional regulator [Verrucomicrobia bacterium]|nr:sigma 54-interacting transcriptional regulator [Verrucomicrobiota bacterium]
MKTDALKVWMSQGILQIESTTLETDENGSLATARDKQPATAYVVPKEQLEALRKSTDHVSLRAKHEAKSLASLLTGRRRIPVLDGGYKSAGRLEQSLRAFFKHAGSQQERNIYVIGTSADIFRQLWAKTGGEAQNGDVTAADSGDFARSWKGLLPQVLIPDELAKSYVGNSESACYVRRLIMVAAQSLAPVLILGEPGTGKENAARNIHNQSARRSGKFVTVNCGAIPPDLFDSELFGQTRGATAERPGLWLLADGGTLFLDEISELTAAQQAAVFRVIQSGKVRRVGDSTDTAVAARVIATTNRDLKAMVEAEKFRSDLYYRLRGIEITTPPLRDHPEDIPVLAQCLWRRIAGGDADPLPDDVLGELRCKYWPGNARELKSVLASMEAIFGRECMTVDRLRLLLDRWQRPSSAVPDRDAAGELARHPAECLRHLRRAGRVVGECDAAVRQVLDGQRPHANRAAAQAALRRQIAELDMLCMNPVLFNGISAFDSVRTLKDELLQFLDKLAVSPRAARRYWQRIVAPQSRRVIEGIFCQVRELV